MLTRDKVQEMIAHMPEKFSVDDLVEKALLLHKIEIGEQEIKNGEGIDWEDLKKEMEQW